MIDQTGDISGAESVVDVDDRHARGATVEHAEQRRNAPETGAVADTGRDGDHGHADQPSHHAWQGSLHTGDDDDCARGGQAVALPEERWPYAPGASRSLTVSVNG